MPPNRETNRRRFLKTTGTVTGVGFLAGCLGGASDGNANDDDGGAAQKTKELSLKEKAKQEGNVSIAQSTSGMTKFYNQFEQKYGIAPRIFRTDSGKVGTRIIQEQSAGKTTFDIVQLGAPSVVYQLTQQDVYTEYPKTAVRGSPARIGGDGTVALSFLYKGLVLLYNKDEVKNPPQTLSDLFSEKWKGRVTVDVRDSELVLAARDIFGSKEKVAEFLRNLGNIATWRSSHFDAAKQIARGAVPMGITYAKYRTYEWGKGVLASVPIETFPRTAVATYNGLVTGAPHPDAGTFTLGYINENVIPYFERTQGESLYFGPKKAEETGLWYLTVNEASEVNLEKIDQRYKTLTGLGEVE